MVRAAGMSVRDAAATEPGADMGQPLAHMAEAEIAAEPRGLVAEAARHVAEPTRMTESAHVSKTAAEAADMAEATTEAACVAEASTETTDVATAEAAADVAAAKPAAAMTTTAAPRPHDRRRHNGAERDRHDRRQGQIPLH
jgi:hypothetical protein